MYPHGDFRRRPDRSDTQQTNAHCCAPSGAAKCRPLRIREFGGNRNSATTYSCLLLLESRHPCRQRHISTHALLAARVPRPTSAFPRDTRDSQNERSPVHPPSTSVCFIHSLVVAVGIILTRMCSATFGAICGGLDSGRCILQQVLEFQRFDQVGIPDQRTISDTHVVERTVGVTQKPHSLIERFAGSKYCGVILHDLLHFEPDLGRGP